MYAYTLYLFQLASLLAVNLQVLKYTPLVESADRILQLVYLFVFLFVCLFIYVVAAQQ